MSAKKKKASNPLVEAFEEFANAVTEFKEATEKLEVARAEVLEAQRKLAEFGINVSVPNLQASNPTIAPAAYPSNENPTGEVETEGPTMHADAIGPSVSRSPSETDVAKIRSESYGEPVPDNVDPEDASSLATAAGQAMTNIIAGLTKKGGKLTVGPQIPGQPTQQTEGENPPSGPVENPHDKNQYGGPITQKPVE